MLRTMSAKTVVVATRWSVAPAAADPEGAADAPEPPQAATISEDASPVIGQKRRRATRRRTGRMADPRSGVPHALGRLRPVPDGGLAGLARRTQAEHLQPVVVDAIARPPGDVLDDGAQARVGDRIAPTAAGADDVVVVGGLAADVGVLARGQVEPFDRTELLSTSSVRKTVARPTPRRWLRAVSISSAAVKWPSWSAMRAATERLGAVRR